MNAATVTPLRPQPKDPTAATRSRRYRSRKAAATVTPAAETVTVSTLQIAQLAGRLHGGELTVSPADADLASRLLGALVRMLPRDGSIEI